MRIARIVSLGALYGASASAQISEANAESIVNPIDFGVIVDVRVARATDAGDYPRAPCLAEYWRKFKKDQREAHRANLLKRAKRLGNRKPLPKSKI